MKGLVTFVLAALVATAAADPPPKQAAVRRKPASPEYSPEALSKFVDAIILDKAGDLGSATHAYRDSLRGTEHPHTHYNLANVLHRMEYYDQAIRAYRKYLELAPDATDRKAVEKIIADIEAMPYMAVIDGDDAGAIVLIDGKLVGPSPAFIYPTEGRHIAERIGPRSYAHRDFFVIGARPRTDHHSLGYKEAEGNVVLSVGKEVRMNLKWEHKGVKVALPGRFALPPGRHELTVPYQKACEKIVFDVAKGDHITHVYVDTPWKPGDENYGCLPITVHVQKLKVEP